MSSCCISVTRRVTFSSVFSRWLDALRLYSVSMERKASAPKAIISAIETVVMAMPKRKRIPFFTSCVLVRTLHCRAAERADARLFLTQPARHCRSRHGGREEEALHTLATERFQQDHFLHCLHAFGAHHPR